MHRILSFIVLFIVLFIVSFIVLFIVSFTAIIISRINLLLAFVVVGIMDIAESKPVSEYSLEELIATRRVVPQAMIDEGYDPTPGRPGRLIKATLLTEAMGHPGRFHAIMSHRFYGDIKQRIDYIAALIQDPSTSGLKRAVEWKPCSTVARLEKADVEIKLEIQKIVDGWKREIDERHYYSKSLVPPITPFVPSAVMNIIIKYLWTYLIHCRIVGLNRTPIDPTQEYVVAYAAYDEWSSEEEERLQQEAEAQKAYEIQARQEWEEQQAEEDRTPQGSSNDYDYYEDWNTQDEEEEEQMLLSKAQAQKE